MSTPEPGMIHNGYRPYIALALALAFSGFVALGVGFVLSVLWRLFLFGWDVPS